MCARGQSWAVFLRMRDKEKNARRVSEVGEKRKGKVPSSTLRMHLQGGRASAGGTLVSLGGRAWGKKRKRYPLLPPTRARTPGRETEMEDTVRGRRKFLPLQACTCTRLQKRKLDIR